jgi:hypothetical protein
MMTPHRSLAIALGAVLLALLLGPAAVAAQEAERAMRFFSDGGAYCFRIAPEGTNLADEPEWRIMLLTGAANRRNDFRVRTVDPGRLRLDGEAVKELGMVITGVWRRDRIRDEFFEEFANGIRRGITRARVTTIKPPRLERMARTERAELYLDWADRGSRVDFSRAQDLTAEAFLAYQTYVPD